jgi:hypothetical protein
MGFLVVAGVLLVQWPRFSQGVGDFLQFYTGAVLAGTDGLYSVAANREVHLRLAGFSTQGTYFVRLPFYAAALSPLALLSYLPAYWLFQSVSIALAAVVALLNRGPWQLKAAIALFLPLALSVIVGQDIALMLLLCTVALLLHKSGRGAAAGLVFSLCIIKFHLFVLVPLVLIRHRKWRMIGGVAVGAVAWLAISTVVAGPAWPMRYLTVLQNPAINPDLDRMPSIRGIFLGSPLAVYAAIVVLAVFMYVILKLRDFEAAFGLALAGGLLLNTHSYIYDCVILLPALISAIRCGSPAARGTALFLMTPIPYVLLLLGHGGLLLLCVVALALMRTADAATSSRGLCSTA